MHLLGVWFLNLKKNPEKLHICLQFLFDSIKQLFSFTFRRLVDVNVGHNYVSHRAHSKDLILIRAEFRILANNKISTITKQQKHQPLKDKLLKIHLKRLI